MHRVNRNQTGFGVIGIVVVVGALVVVGGAGAYVYHRNHKSKTTTSSTKTSTQASNSTQTSTAQKAATSSITQAKANAMATWADFSNTNLGLKFRYPSDWEQATITTMNPTPDDPSGTFYKISFGNLTYAYITVNPAQTMNQSEVTFSSLKDQVKDATIEQHVFANEPTVVGAVEPDIGNGQSVIYSARSISLPKVDASYIQLFDARKYGGSCSQNAYVSCYTASELQDYQWLLESASSF